ncbi:MAG TPA: hypothetical protein VEJ19_08025 [Nitrososphaerales archaeon]|nr:hypothetical protein [Nitrososphaerales archaeon]
MKKPTKEDAELYLELIQTFSTPSDHEAGNWFMREFTAKDYEEFKTKYPVNSEGLLNVSRILAFYEVAGALVSHGLLNENLLFDASDIAFTWGKLEKIIPGWQKETSPALWENAAWLGKRYKVWQKKVWKPNLKWKTSSS